MIRTTAVPRPRTTGAVRSGAAAASVLGIVALAGCAASATAEPEATTATPTTTASASPSASASASASATAAASDSTYTDGTYTADGAYVDGGGQAETVTVTITLADDVVTDVEVTGSATSGQSRQYQQAFIGGIAAVVEGKNIDDLSVSRVAGSSLTSGGFNNALEKIKSEAQA